jgi:hypothetical protein
MNDLSAVVGLDFYDAAGHYIGSADVTPRADGTAQLDGLDNEMCEQSVRAVFVDRAGRQLESFDLQRSSYARH